MSTKLDTRSDVNGVEPEIDTDVDGPSDAQTILRSVVLRKKAGGAKKIKKTQPWKQTHAVAPEDLPTGRDMLHETPWFNPDEYPVDDSSYAA